MKRARIHFATHLESQMDYQCPATQDAIDRISAEYHQSGADNRLHLLDLLRRRDGSYTATDFCSAIMTAWQAEDIHLATGRSKDWWIRLINRAE